MPIVNNELAQGLSNRGDFSIFKKVNCFSQDWIVKVADGKEARKMSFSAAIVADFAIERAVTTHETLRRSGINFFKAGGAQFFSFFVARKAHSREKEVKCECFYRVKIHWRIISQTPPVKEGFG